MQRRNFAPLIEAFLVLEQPRQRFSHWTQALAPLDDDRAPPLASVNAYYDPANDQALLGLRYDELALGSERLAFVIEIALLAEIGMIQPAELSEGDRRRFLNERLTRCTVHVANQRNVVSALTELVRGLREQRVAPMASRTNTTQPLNGARAQPPPIPAARASVKPRGTTDDPVLLVSPKSTRDNLQQYVDEREPVPTRPTRDSIPRIAPPEVVTRKTRDSIPRIPEPPPLPPPEPIRHERHSEFQRTPSPNVIARPRPSDVHRAQTVEVDMGEAETVRVSGSDPALRISPPPGTLSADASPGRGAPRNPTVTSTEPYLPTVNAPPLPPGIIYARYLRSGRWVPIRIGALSLKGAALMTGALPRLHDTVDVALTFSGHRALVRGPVNKVSSEEEALLSGAPSFSVKFDLDDAARRQLTTLLTAARAANITIKPPPPRGARRYPVEWPVCLGTMRGAVRAEALDVSREGMFVRPANALTLDTNLNFSAVLDDGSSPISGRAKVVRHITDAEARSCGLASGYGLNVVDMGDLDRERWQNFLSRIEKRADKRVLIGASPTRLVELQTVLASAGYAVTGGTDPSALVQLASAEARPVDAALLDGGWLTNGTPTTWVESLFAARNVPYVTMHGDARRARNTIDKLLAVV